MSFKATLSREPKATRLPKAALVYVLGTQLPPQMNIGTGGGGMPSAWIAVDSKQLSEILTHHVQLVVFAADITDNLLEPAIAFIRTAAPTVEVVVIACDEVRKRRTDVDLVFVPSESAAVSRGAGVANPLQLNSDLEEIVRLVSNGAPTSSLAARMLQIVLVPVALVGFWWLAVAIFQPPTYILPSPQQVAAAFAEQPLRYLSHTGSTASQAFAGFLLGNCAGIGLAILLFRFVQIRALTLPALIALQAVPIIAIAPLLGVWLGTGAASKIAMAAIICFFPMVVNTLQAFGTVEREHQDLFTIYRASFKRRLLHLLIPSATPSIVAALRIAGGLAVVGAIIAEMTGSSQGLGYLILNGAYRLETTVLFVAMVLASILGILFFRIPDGLKFLLPVNWRRGLFSRGELSV